MKYSDLQRESLKTIGDPSSYVYKNKIINGDFQVKQNLIAGFKNEENDGIDKFYCKVDSGEVLLSLASPIGDIGEKAKDTDPFGDGSLHNLWCLDGDASDETGNNDGTVNGDVTFVDDGVFGKSAAFDGDGDYISTDFKIDDSKQYTLSAWFKTDATGVVISSSDSDSTAAKKRGRIEVQGENLIRIFMGDDNSYSYKDISAKVTDSKWHHTVVSIDGYNQSVYVDGKKLGTYTLSVSAGTASDYTYSIGRSGEADKDYFKGKIGWTEIYLGKSLTQEEVLEVYFKQKVKFETRTNLIRPVGDVDVTNTNEFKPHIYRFTGRDVYSYKQSKITLSFLTQSNKTGVFTCALINKTDSDNIQSYLQTFTIDTENILEKKELVFDLSNFKDNFKDDDNTSIELVIFGTNDDDYKSSDTGVVDGYYIMVDGSETSFSRSDYVSVRELQLELGDKSTEFERKTVTIETLESNGVKNQCTAWVNFDGNNGTIRDSFNISNVIRNDVGDYIVEFEVEMNNINYSVAASSMQYDNSTEDGRAVGGYTSKSFKVNTQNAGAEKEDHKYISLIVFGGKE